MKKFLLILSAAFALSACTRIGTGEVGVRVDAYKQIQGARVVLATT